MRIGYYQLADQVIEFIQTESARAYPSETGGILIGKLSDNCVVITQAVGPGLNAEHASYHFRRDGEHSQRILDRFVTESNGEYDYIGEWHSHPAPYGPSPTDIVAIRWVAANKKYSVSHPIMALCTKELADNWLMSLYIFDGRQMRGLKLYSAE